MNSTQEIFTVRYSELTLLKNQRQALTEKLDGTAFNKTEEGWFFARKEFEKIARPFEGNDIEDSVEWTPRIRNVNERVDPRRKAAVNTAEIDEFLKPLVAAGYFKSIDAADVMWSLFKSLMKDRLINDQKPVPLGFARLYAFPYRINWRQIVFSRDIPKMRKDRSGGHAVRSRAAIVARGTAHFLTDETLTAWNEDKKHVEWNLEVVPTKDWDELVTLAELARKSIRRKFGYFPGIVDTLRRLLPYALDVYEHFIERIRLPHVVLYTRSRDSFGRITAKGNAKQGTPERRGQSNPRAQPNFFDPAVAEGTEGVSECPDSGVRAVFRFQPTNEKVWGAREAVAEPIIKPELSTGMPVPDGRSGEV